MLAIGMMAALLLAGCGKKRTPTCSGCGAIFDRRSLDEVLFHHTDHKDRPDIQYSGSEKLD
jgi:hypothetical protein